MDLGIILIVFFMIFFIGRIIVSGLNFDFYFFFYIVKGSKVCFLFFLLIDNFLFVVVLVIYV